MRRLVLLLLLLVGALVGCSKEVVPFPGIYSDINDGRFMDYGPQGLFAEKRDGNIMTGVWSLKENQFSQKVVTFPDPGRAFEARAEWTKQDVKFYPPGSETYESLIREPTKMKSDEIIVGLWKNVTDKSVNLIEFTPWRSMIWVRWADHTKEVKIAGGRGEYSTRVPGRLAIKSGIEYNYEIHGYDNYSYTVTGRQLEMTNSSNKEKITYQRVEPAELPGLAEKIIASDPTKK